MRADQASRLTDIKPTPPREEGRVELNEAVVEADREGAGVEVEGFDDAAFAVADVAAFEPAELIDAASREYGSKVDEIIGGSLWHHAQARRRTDGSRRE